MINKWKYMKVGDTFEFGSYAPEGDHKKLPICWRVLAMEDDRMLVLAEKILDLQTFHREEKPVRWENSDLRQWLNTVFWNTAFAEAEQELICQPEPHEDPFGELFWQLFDMETATSDISDRVFLLSQADIMNYFPGEGSFFPGAEADESEHIQHLGGYDQCWWLRSSMKDWSAAMIVSPCASIGVSMLRENNRQGVRPAMWVKL